MSAILNILIVGNDGVGKTTFIERHRIGEFEKEYKPTYGTRTSLLTFQTNHGPISFYVKEIGGHWSKLIDSIQKDEFDGIIIMFDLTASETYRSDFRKWYKPIVQRFPNLSIVLCGTKHDLSPHAKCVGEDTLTDQVNVKAYFRISAKTCYNYEKPFLAFASSLLGSNVEFVDAPVPELPPKKTVNWVKLPIGMLKITYRYNETETETDKKHSWLTLPNGDQVLITYGFYSEHDIVDLEQ